MHEIITNLYLGGLRDRRDNEVLKTCSIRGVVTCCTQWEARDVIYPPPGGTATIPLCHVDVADSGVEPISEFFNDAADFIDKFLNRGESVLVHCKSGVSRSATVILCYLVTRKNFSLHDAFFHVRSKREVVSPNMGFMRQLCAVERSTHSRPSPSICMLKYMDWYTADFGDRSAVPELCP
eukprot:Lankesteria_metandrocarpae@DN4329_c0_g1_i1.p1